MSHHRTTIPHLLRAISRITRIPEVRHRSYNACASSRNPQTRPSVPQTRKSTPKAPLEQGETKFRRPQPADKRTVRYTTLFVPGFAFILGLYITTVYVSWNNKLRKHVALPQNADVSDRWRQLGRDYDDEVEWCENNWITNLAGKRRRLVQRAYGAVLEVSAGTGRNFDYYNLNPFDPTKGSRDNMISRLTVNDQSPVMIATAEKKFEQLQSRTHFAGNVEFIVGNAGLRGVIQRPEGGYDTIIQTMGLCSMADPVRFLKTMGNLCRQPGERSKTQGMQAGIDDGRGGRILLLEHGRSDYETVNYILDRGASMHADHYGCWWNKDIAEIVEQSGLVVERIKRYHLGTTWEIHLRPRKRV